MTKLKVKLEANINGVTEDRADRGSVDIATDAARGSE